jgi:predicted DNA-binding transcriptional regulator AlpA
VNGVTHIVPGQPGRRPAKLATDANGVAARLLHLADAYANSRLDDADLVGQLTAVIKRVEWAHASAAPATPEADETVDVREAAKLLGMSPTWLYRNAKKLPFTRRVGPRTLRFSVAGIRKYLVGRRPA